jgi:hypothetical protein
MPWLWQFQGIKAVAFFDNKVIKVLLGREKNVCPFPFHFGAHTSLFF